MAHKGQKRRVKTDRPAAYYRGYAFKARGGGIDIYARGGVGGVLPPGSDLYQATADSLAKAMEWVDTERAAFAAARGEYL